MRPTPTVRALVAAALLVPALGACASRAAQAARASRAEAANGTATLEVSNRYVGPVDLYAVSDAGFAQRIASSISSTRTTRITLPAAVIAGTGGVRILAVPLAESGRASTGRIVVRPGDVVQFNIAPDLLGSTVFIR